MRSASVRFYGSLNDFLPAASRQSTLVCTFDNRQTVKDFIEALGVPHPEIDLLVVDGYAGALCLEWERMWHPALAPIETALDRLDRFSWWNAAAENKA